MRRLILLALLAVLAVRANAADHASRVTVDELQQALAASENAHRADGEVAEQLAGMELTERLSAARLARLKADLPGVKAQQALVALADMSVFLDPPDAEIPARPRPDAAGLRQMLVSLVNYVNTTVRQLPNFMATRDTTRFEDRPLQDVQGPVGMTTLIYLPLHVVGRSNVLVAYRDGHEVLEKVAEKSKRGESQERGLFTEGVFGPILSTVVGDALKGQITWSRWEEGASGTEAVFHYSVPKEKSHYSVGFCCVAGGVTTETHELPGSYSLDSPEPTDLHSFAEIAAYHGEFAFDPASGAILRITLEADMPPHEVVSKNGMRVEYGAVDIAGKSYICPLRGVSMLMAHSTKPPLGMQRLPESYVSPTKTFLNDAVFEQYRRFGSETRIVSGDGGVAGGSAPGAVAADSTSPQSAPEATTEAAEMSAPAAAAAVAAPTPVPAIAPAVPEEPEISVGAASDLEGTNQAGQPMNAALDQAPGYTLKVTSRLVDVGVVAVDKKGHPVTDLKAEDFEVYDNGVKQEIRFFGAFDASAPAADHAGVAAGDVTFSNRAAEANAGSRASGGTQSGATILLMDESHMAWTDLNNARAQMLEFLASAPAGERIGLYTMSSLGFGVLVDVTTDHAALTARLKKWMPTAQSVAQAQNEETRNRQQFSEVRNVSDLSSVNGNQAELPDGLSPVDPQLLNMGSNPARASLIILVGVARRLAAVPGHKNLIWFSSDNVFAEWRDQQVAIDRNTGSLDSFALRAQEAMNDAHVAVYPFDVSQLESSSITADTQHRNVELTPTNPLAGSMPVDSTGGRNKAEMLQDTHPIQGSVRQVAEATGGRTIRRSSDLAGALSEIVEDGHAIYQLSFSPDQPADGKYHAITVRFSGKLHGLTLHYRTGYLYTKEPVTLKERFQQAVWQPADANEVTVTTEVHRMEQGANMKIVIAAGDLDLEKQADRWMDRLDVFFVKRDDAGVRAQVEQQTLGLRLKEPTYRQVLSTGIPYEHEVKLNKGVASVRIVVVDKNSGRMGSVTIPVSAIGSDGQ